MRLAKQILVDIIKEEVQHVLERRKKFRVYRMFSRDYSGEELMNRLENPKIKPIMVVSCLRALIGESCLLLRAMLR